jgi:oligopeptide transport system permease protein
MIGFIARRIVLMLITLFIVVSATWFLMQLLPGSPFNAEKLSAEQEAIMNERYGLDDPLLVQYGRYMLNVAHGDLGVSFYYENQSVSGIIASRLPISAFLGAQAIIFGTAVGLLLGAVGAMRHNTWADSGSVILAVLGKSFPNFVFAAILQYLLGFKLQWLPQAGFDSYVFSILPSLALSVFVIAIVARFIRSEMLEVLGQDYVTLAKSKGISQSTLVIRHVLKNSLIPIITILGPLIVALVTGSLVVEQIFAIPGIGNQFVNSIFENDYSMILGTTIFFAALFIVSILIQDILYTIVDPRMRLAGAKE